MTSGKRRQTFEKMNRERKVREKRALKAEKRELRRLGPPATEPTIELVDGEEVVAPPEAEPTE